MRWIWNTVVVLVGWLFWSAMVTPIGMNSAAAVNKPAALGTNGARTRLETLAVWKR